MKKTRASLALAGLLTFTVGTGVAQAAPEYPAGPPASTVSQTTVVPGQAIVFSGGGMTPGEIVDVTATQTSPVAGGAIGSLGGGVSASVPMIIKPAASFNFTTTAAADGTFSVPVELDLTGTYTLTATGRTSGTSVSQVVKVVTSLPGGAPVAGNNNGTGNGTGNNIAGVEKGGLAATGIDSSVLIWSLVGVGALAAGVGTVVVSRRRSRVSAEA